MKHTGTPLDTSRPSTHTARHRAALAAIFGKGKSPKVEELISYTDASQPTGIPVHRLQYATTKGELIAVPMPNGKNALIEANLNQWLASTAQGA